MNNETLTIEVLAPDQKILGREIEECTAPGFEGEFGVLPGHAPLFVKIKTGVLKFIEKGKNHYLAVSGGLSEVTGKNVVVLTEKALFSDKIDLKKAEREKRDAENRIKSLSQKDKEYDRAMEDLEWATACINASKEGGK
ncbi:MAG: ATP synthase F1 subunit epsilon [Thermodesulfobacteriota bacterium]|nr:ATP synthase F1 subunit epsilon [Thermodesulfobacteriota bacterium]